jgi:hypothetical protein
MNIVPLVGRCPISLINHPVPGILCTKRGLHWLHILMRMRVNLDNAKIWSIFTIVHDISEKKAEKWTWQIMVVLPEKAFAELVGVLMIGNCFHEKQIPIPHVVSWRFL